MKEIGNSENNEGRVRKVCGFSKVGNEEVKDIMHVNKDIHIYMPVNGLLKV